MLLAGGLQSPSLDLPTLSLVAVCIAGLLGLFLIIDWMQQRNVRALAWWGSAYLIGASAMALGTMPAPFIKLPAALPGALTFLACGMVWNGVRLFQGRRVLPFATFIGAALWLGLAQIPGMMENGNGEILGALIVPVYTFFIAMELWRERRRTRYSRAAAVVVPCLHAGVFLVPLAMRAFLPDGHGGAWLTIFTLETILYAVGTAFIVMLMVKDHHVHVYRTAASTDHLTGLLNRRAFIENAQTLRKRQARRGEPVAVLMFDLDRFKSINDRFGHSAGDEVLRLFARVTRASTRLNDIIGRFGGEEFIAIVPGGIEVARKIAERVRTAFEKAGAVIESQPIGATVSIGAASSYDATMTVDALIAKADAALYRAKHDGRNRVIATESENASERARLIAAARRARPLGLVAFARVSQRSKSARSG
ncbi:MAG TPA: GGDEF domain-containing protein [Pseudolabrys sp.]|nr:GGDEF domain-containing protein [Pseudolabrys sp.]